MKMDTEIKFKIAACNIYIFFFDSTMRLLAFPSVLSAFVLLHKAHAIKSANNHHNGI